MDIRVEKVTRMKVAGMMHRGPYHTISATWMQMGQWLSSLNGAADNRQRFSVYLDDPNETAPEELRSLATVNAKGLEIPEDFEDRFIAGGNYAIFEHNGPYELLGAAWAAFRQQVEADEKMTQRDSVCFEEYLNDPMSTPPAELKTVLYLPVKVKK